MTQLNTLTGGQCTERAWSQEMPVNTLGLGRREANAGQSLRIEVLRNQIGRGCHHPEMGHSRKLVHPQA